MRIALAGNPNSGKTTMFNALTGRNEKVGNWAGVTVDKSESAIRKVYQNTQEEIIIVDLPGAYSMSPFTCEESITRDYIESEKIDVIINIVDSTNLSRSLFFTTQLLEIGIPVVVALNKSDINKKRNTIINEEKLSKILGCPVICTVLSSKGNEGLKQLIDNALDVVNHVQISPYKQEKTDLHDKQKAKIIDKERFEFVKSVVLKVERKNDLDNKSLIQDKIDSILTYPVIGIGVFAVVMFIVFYISQSEGVFGIGKLLEGAFTGWIEKFQVYVSGLCENANPFLRALLVDGIIGGVGAVVGFLPLVMVMYFLIALLEDCGYMARATVVLDPIFKKVGLSGKSVIPMIVGTGCSIPGIMACRTIKDERERRATAMLTPLMPCGAKLPLIALFSGAFFKNAAWVGVAMYFTGILLILLGAYLIKLMSGCKNNSYFIIELPEYKVPSIKRAFLSMIDRGKEYIVKAGTIILVCNTIVQITQSFDWKLNLVSEEMQASSILATIAAPISYLLVPIVGVASWQLAASVITGFIAKENVVGTLAVCYGLNAFIDTEELMLIGDGGAVASVMGLTKVAALSFLMFNLFSPPCFAAIGAMNSEMNDKKWLRRGIAFLLCTGYFVSFIVYQAGTLITTGRFGKGVASGSVALIGVISYIVVIHKKYSE